jgi:hypothetical protein
MLLKENDNSEMAQMLDVFNQDYQTTNKTVLDYPTQDSVKTLSPRMQRIFKRLSQELEEKVAFLMAQLEKQGGNLP